MSPYPSRASTPEPRDFRDDYVNGGSSPPPPNDSRDRYPQQVTKPDAFTTPEDMAKKISELAKKFWHVLTLAQKDVGDERIRGQMSEQNRKELYEILGSEDVRTFLMHHYEYLYDYLLREMKDLDSGELWNEGVKKLENLRRMEMGDGVRLAAILQAYPSSSLEAVKGDVRRHHDFLELEAQRRKSAPGDSANLYWLASGFFHRLQVEIPEAEDYLMYLVYDEQEGPKNRLESLLHNKFLVDFLERYKRGEYGIQALGRLRRDDRQRLRDLQEDVSGVHFHLLKWLQASREIKEHAIEDMIGTKNLRGARPLKMMEDVVGDVSIVEIDLRDIQSAQSKMSPFESYKTSLFLKSKWVKEFDHIEQEGEWNANLLKEEEWKTLIPKLELLKMLLWKLKPLINSGAVKNHRRAKTMNRGQDGRSPELPQQQQSHQPQQLQSLTSRRNLPPLRINTGSTEPLNTASHPDSP